MQMNCPAGDLAEKRPAVDESLLPIIKTRFSLWGRYMNDEDFD